jgi:diaminohydroxyphosphoribosylaminopyrimidine deaminase/5-amino-6-(5-phosphoribosylamino)uracil reductase
MLPAGEGSSSISLTAMMESAQRAGVTSMMIEGGGQLAAAFMRASLVDRIEWFRAPVVLGGDGRPCLGDLGLETLNAAPKFDRTSVREIGPDLWESYVRR